MAKEKLAKNIRFGLLRLAQLSDSELLARHDKLKDLYTEILNGTEFTMDGADAYAAFGELLFGKTS